MRQVTTITSTMVATALMLGAGMELWAEVAPDVTLPQTAEEHLAMAVEYEQKAAVSRQEAVYHRQMLEAAYKAEIHSKAPIRRAYEKMRKHCEPIIRDADRLARDMELFAAWHRLRAAELQSQ